ncbi:MAG: hypothetical protein QW448_08050, partial [Thermofilaceae archaeon]
ACLPLPFSLLSRMSRSSRMSASKRTEGRWAIGAGLKWIAVLLSALGIFVLGSLHWPAFHGKVRITA